MEPALVLKKLPGMGLLLLVAALGACQHAVDGPGGSSAQRPALPRQRPKPPADSADRPPQAATTGARSDSQAVMQVPPEADKAAGDPLAAGLARPQQAPPAQAAQPEQTVQPAGKPAAQTTDIRQSPAPAESTKTGTATKPELQPLVDDPQSLQRLHPFYPVWIDRQRRHVVMVGQVCQRRAPLELFACLRGSKEHEAVVAVDTKAYVVHAGLLAVGAEPGSPVRFEPQFIPPSGPEIEITVIWEDQWGRRRQARAQDWVRDVAELYAMFDGVVLNQFDEELNVADQWAAWRSMEYPWVFAGSQFLKDERTGQQYYQADIEGDLVCVSNFSSAVLDVPIRSTDSNAALLFDAFTERIPPRGTPVTLILTPKRGKKPPSRHQQGGPTGGDRQPGQSRPGPTAPAKKHTGPAGPTSN